jgi:O-antigen ligase
MTSSALWLPLLWVFILSSRPLSLWLQGKALVQTADAYLEGSPMDRYMFLLMIILGFVVLQRRAMSWGVAFSRNPWMFLFYIFLGLSCVWSDYSFVSFKRWIKDIGNVIMVLIILTEKEPTIAVRALFARLMYFTVPLSIVLFKYFPHYGRYLSSSWENTACGVATEKNALGCLAFLAGMFLVWDFIHLRNKAERKPDRLDLITRCGLMWMVLWTLKIANSSTAWVCLVLGAAMIWLMSLKFAQRQVRHLGTYCFAAAAAVVLFYSTPALFQAFLEFLGEDVTLTGRTELWAELIKEDINPLLGTGHQAFWLGPRLQAYWDRWAFHPNQAHNGYIETYLNTGFISLALLLMLIFANFRNLKPGLSQGSPYAILRFALFVIVLFYNWTEAMFNKLSPIWFFFLLAVFEYARVTVMASRPAETAPKVNPKAQFSSVLAPLKPL